jgi:transcriptional regulator with XRE-family HTH domain
MGVRLKKLRQERGLSQGQLAKLSGVPKGTLLQWEYGLRTPKLDAAAKLADALDVSLDELAGRQWPTESPPEPPTEPRPQPPAEAPPEPPAAKRRKSKEK